MGVAAPEDGRTPLLVHPCPSVVNKSLSAGRDEPDPRRAGRLRDFLCGLYGLKLEFLKRIAKISEPD
jgi:hypothetical protein